MMLDAEAKRFRRTKDDERRHAGSVAAFYLSTGIDLADAMAADQARQHRIILRLERMLERERLRGQRNHWSYDLNRHMALKEARDSLRRSYANKKAAPEGAARMICDLTAGR